MKIKTEAMYRGRLYQIAEAPEGYLISYDCGKGVGNYDRVAPIKDYEEAVRAVKLEIDRFVDRHEDDIILFGDDIKVGATLYSHETNEKCKVIEFNGSTMTVKFENGDTQEFGSDYAFDVIDDSDEAQFDIVCEGRTENGMRFQIITDDQNKDKGYGFAVAIWPCFENDYTQYSWGYATLHSVFEEIESTYSENYEKCKFLKPGGHALVRLHGKKDSDLISVSSCCNDSVTYTVAGSYEYQTSKLKDVVVLHAVITLWSDECLESHVGWVFRRVGDSNTQLALGTYSAYDIIYLNLAGKDYAHGKSAKQLAEFYEVKTEEGWKPCYHIKWEDK